MTTGVAAGYLVEQVVICVSGVMALACSSWRVFNQESTQALAKPLQKTFNRALIVISVIGIIWGVDPRGIWDFYSPEAIAVCKDFITSSLMCPGVVWMDAHLRIIAESLGKLKVQDVSKKITIGIPVLCIYTITCIFLILSIVSQLGSYRSCFIFFLTFIIFCECLTVTACLVHIIRIRQRD
jgi:hypothetical protein